MGASSPHSRAPQCGNLPWQQERRKLLSGPVDRTVRQGSISGPIGGPPANSLPQALATATGWRREAARDGAHIVK